MRTGTTVVVSALMAGLTVALPASTVAQAADAPQLERINPPGLSLPQGYAQVVTAEGGGRWVFVAGQGGIAADGSVPEDLGEQARIMFEKVAIALTAADASPADVVRIVLYIVDLENIDPSPIYAAVRAFFPPEARPASSVIGVSALAVPGMAVEIDVTALTAATDASATRED